MEEAIEFEYNLRPFQVLNPWLNNHSEAANNEVKVFYNKTLFFVALTKNISANESKYMNKNQL